MKAEKGTKSRVSPLFLCCYRCSIPTGPHHHVGALYTELDVAAAALHLDFYTVELGPIKDTGGRADGNKAAIILTKFPVQTSSLFLFHVI